jgi:anti-anti-sigma regulatory factor
MKRSHGHGNGLSYYIHDEVAAFRLQLAGDLSRQAAADLDQVRRTAFSVLGGRPLVVDLTGIESIDAEGCDLLDRWHTLGAHFVVTARKAVARIRSMTGVPLRIPEVRRWRCWP